jgi:hypothetical protein
MKMKRSLGIAGIALGVLFTLGMTAYTFANTPKDPTQMLGVVVARGAASLNVADQPGASGSIIVDSLVAPGPSWIVVHLDMDGKPGDRVGVLAVPAGSSTKLTVPIENVTLTDKLIVALHADRGVAGTFDFDMKAFASSPDKPYFIDGKELAHEVAVR